MKSLEILVVLSSTVVNRHCSPNGTSSFVYNHTYSWIIVRHRSVVLIPWWTDDQSRISVLHSSPPVDQPYWISNSSWDIRTGSSWKANYDFLNGQYANMQDCFMITLRISHATPTLYRSCSTIVLNSSKHSWLFPDHHDSPGIMSFNDITRVHKVLRRFV